MHSAAAETAVSASISTPVGATVRTQDTTRILPVSGREKSTVACESGMGWHRGRIRGVALAAMIPAMRATARTSPLGTFPPRTILQEEGERRTHPSATASRSVAGFPEMSAMTAVPGFFTFLPPFPGRKTTVVFYWNNFRSPPEINSHILFETVFQLNDLLPSRWTAAQRKEVAYILERMGMEIPKTIAERLRESGFIYVLQD